MARIPQASQEQFAELIRQARFPENTPPTTVFRLLAHAPAVATPALQLVAAILKELALDPRLRQLVVLRVIHRCQARYARVQRAAIAAAVGVNNAQIAALERGDRPIDLFADREQALLAFADEILEGPRVSDETFARLRGQFSPREVVEVLLTVGYFRMIGSLMTTLDVEPDPAWAVTMLWRALDPDPGARG
jgi:alkylhydroperoxidase family enzyme